MSFSKTMVSPSAAASGAELKVRYGVLPILQAPSGYNGTDGTGAAMADGTRKRRRKREQQDRYHNPFHCFHCVCLLKLFPDALNVLIGFARRFKLRVESFKDSMIRYLYLSFRLCALLCRRSMNE